MQEGLTCCSSVWLWMVKSWFWEAWCRRCMLPRLARASSSALLSDSSLCCISCTNLASVSAAAVATACSSCSSCACRRDLSNSDLLLLVATTHLPTVVEVYEECVNLWAYDRCNLLGYNPQPLTLLYTIRRTCGRTVGSVFPRVINRWPTKLHAYSSRRCTKPGQIFAWLGASAAVSLHEHSNAQRISR